MRQGSDAPGVAIMVPPAQSDPHGTLRLGAATYGDGFRALGRRVWLVECGQMDRQTVERLQSPEIGVLFSAGGWVHAVQVSDGDKATPLAALVGKPVIQLLCDNPCGHWMTGITATDDPQQTTAALDADFFTLWSRWAPRQGARLIYVPACPVVEAAPAAARDIDRLVAAWVPQPEKFRNFVIDKYPQAQALALFDGIVDLGLFEGLRPFSEICDEVMNALNIQLVFTDPNARLLLYLADQFIRARRRRAMLARLAAFPITLAGGGEDIPLHPDSRIIPPVDHGALLQLYRRARVVVASPPYAGGISERITHPMAAGAMVAAPPTSLSDRLMGRNQLYATVAADFSDLAQAMERAADPHIWAETTAAAHAYATRTFSAEATVKGLMDGVLDYANGPKQ